MHFAAWLSVGDSVKDPVGYYDNNVGGTLAVLRAMVEARRHALHLLVDRGHLRRTRSRRRSPRAIRSGRSTPTARPSWRSSARCRTSSGPTASARSTLRYFNAAGADPDGMLGEDHAPEIHVIPARHRRRARPRLVRDLRRRLRHAGRHLPARLRPRHGPGRRAHLLALESLRAGGAVGVIQSRQRHGRSRCARWSTPVERVTGRPVPVDDRRRAGRAIRRVLYASSDKIQTRARLDAALRGPRRHRRDGLALACRRTRTATRTAPRSGTANRGPGTECTR